MNNNKDNDKENGVKKEDVNSFSFLKIDMLTRRSHALNLLLRNDDIIVGFNGELFKGNQKTLNQNLKIEDLKVLTILRKKIFFNVKVNGPLGIKLLEIGNEEAQEINKEAEDFLTKNKNYDNFKEFEVYKGSKNYYDIIEINETSLFASLLPFVWFIHHRLYSPLLLLLATFMLLGSIEWWLFLAAWVITTFYMSKSSLSLLRGYCLFNEMKPYMKIFSLSSKAVQETIRMLDKKSNYRFPMIEGPVDNDSDNNKEKEATQNLNVQEAT